MPTPGAHKIFLSYGRADASALVDKLAHDLAQHTVAGYPRYAAWKDRAEMKAGRAWTAQLAAALRDVDVVVAVLSPHAVRSRADGRSTGDSVCLDEISFARFGAQKPIVPAMAILCTPPFEIFRLDYVDFTQWKTPPSYDHAFLRLLDGIGAALRGETHYRAWSDRLQPWDYGNYLAEKRRGFVGRTWLFRELKARIDDAKLRAILVTGGPGFGKSAFVAEYLHRNPDGRVLAFHCCQATTLETLNPSRFVRSVAGMIASRHPAYEALLDQAPYRDVLTEKQCNADPESAFEEGVLAALERLGPPQPGRWVLVVDALDEGMRAPPDSPTSLVQLLAKRLARFPKWLALVATSRPEKPVLDLLANLKPLVIDATDVNNVRDLRRYVSNRLAAPALAAELEASGRKPAWAAKKLGDAAEGNFLYAEQALDALEAGLLEVEDLGKLPPGLTQQYRLFFGRRFTDAASWPSARPLFAALVAAQEPLPDDELAAATGLDAQKTLPQRLAALGAYLRTTTEKIPRHVIFHQSLAEWLTGEDERGGAFGIDPDEGHLLLADGLYGRFVTDRFQISTYALAHLARHLAAATRADKARRPELQRALADFVLDPVVQQKRLDDPFGMDTSLRLALQTAAEGPPTESVPIALRLALGLDAFRRERLDASRIFRLAREGKLGQVETELQLYDADEQWLNATRLVAAWLACEIDRAPADELRARSRTFTVLDERVDAAFERRAPTFPPIDVFADLDAVTQILLQTGGSEAEVVNLNLLWHQAAPPAPGVRFDAKGTRYLAEFQSPTLVAFAQKDRALGTQKLCEYVALNAANAYRVYRNGSLWEILRAVAQHEDPHWVREMAQTIIVAALAGGGREFGGAAIVAAAALRASVDAPSRTAFDGLTQAVLGATKDLAPLRGRGDSWGEHRRTLAAHAEARSLLLKEDVRALLDRALQIPEGYAGFQATACLALAATLALCGAAQHVDGALSAAVHAARNVQDLVFCARSVSRVNAFKDQWWPAAKNDDVAVVDTVARFVLDPHAPEFLPLYLGGEQHPARTLDDLARAYQRPVGDWVKANPGIPSAKAELPDSDAGRMETYVRVPDPRFASMLAAWFAARLLASKVLKPGERVASILRLVPIAANDRTALDTVLARLLLALAPADPRTLDEIDAALASYPLPTTADTAGPEPGA